MNDTLALQIPKNQESPLKQFYDRFDIEHINWGTNDYKINALQIEIEDTNKLLISDWYWRKDHQQNVVASIDGPQGAGKSMPFSYVGLKLGQIFGVPFHPEHTFFSPELFDEGFKTAVHGQTLLKDEDPKTRVGMMSHMIDSNIVDYEEQSRMLQINMLQAGVELRKHAHFFWFEAKHTIFDENAYPIAFVSVLKTPRYTNHQEFVWRGLVRFPMVNEEFVKGYLKRKDENLRNLKAKYGSTLDPVIFFAKSIFKKRKQELVYTRKDGTIGPLKQELLFEIVTEEIGTRRFTTAGYKILIAKLKHLLLKEFEPHNKERMAALETHKELERQKRAQERSAEMEIMSEHRKEKMVFMKEKLLEEKRKNDLKERQLALKEKAVMELAGLLKKKKGDADATNEIRKQLFD